MNWLTVLSWVLKVSGAYQKIRYKLTLVKLHKTENSLHTVRESLLETSSKLEVAQTELEKQIKRNEVIQQATEEYIQELHRIHSLNEVLKDSLDNLRGKDNGEDEYFDSVVPSSISNRLR